VSASSRDSAERAGWREAGTPTTWPGLVRDRVNARWTEFSWLAVRSLLDSANDKIAHNVHDLVNARRMRWVAAQRAAGADPDFRCAVVPRDAETLRFLLVGDPGEGDASQYALVAPLRAKAPGTDFLLLASDVIYPAGDVNDYENAFFLPYWWYDKPILGQPGNHDWYDGLAGFMWHFCGAEPLPPTEYRASSFRAVERVARALWRRASRPNRARLLAWRARLESLDGRRWEPPQPGPYYSIEVRDLKILVIDTGITGVIDREQGDWLLRESAGPKPKLLITGKPVYVNNEYHPGRIVWDDEAPRAHQLGVPAYDTVDAVVRDRHRNFVAVIGGDTHSYQRYTVRVRPTCLGGDEGSERTIEYIVAGGGGAYMSATHTFGTIDMHPRVVDDDDGTDRLPAEVQPVGEEDFRCYPLRGDSVAYYTRPLGSFLAKWAWRSLGALAAVALTVVLAEYVWEPGTIRGRESPEAAGTAAATLLALAGLGGVVVVTGMATGRKELRDTLKGYRFFCSLSVLAAAVLGLVWGARQVGAGDADWIMVGATVAVLLVPVGAVLVGYFTRGAGPLFLGDLVVVVLGAGAVLALAGLEPWTWAGDDGWLAALAVALAALALLVPLAGSARRAGGRPLRRWLIAAAVGMAVLGIARNWDRAPAVAAVVAVGVVLLVLGLAYWVLLLFFLHAAKPLFSGDLVKPTAQRADAIVALVRERLGLEPLPGRADAGAPADAAAARIVDALVSTGGRKRLLDKLISEAADQNAPPFFKQFLRIEVDGGVLRIECYAATGWAEDAHDPPLEDDIAIPLVPGAG
jgi:hypothetical protein